MTSNSNFFVYMQKVEKNLTYIPSLNVNDVLYQNQDKIQSCLDFKLQKGTYPHVPSNS